MFCYRHKVTVVSGLNSFNNGRKVAVIDQTHYKLGNVCERPSTGT